MLSNTYTDPRIDLHPYIPTEGHEDTDSATASTLTIDFAALRDVHVAYSRTHWVADFVDPTPGQNLEEFRREIRSFGVTRFVTRVDGAVIDGIDVLMACEAENVLPLFRDVATDHPAELLISLKTTGSYDEGQRATLVELLSDRALGVTHGGSRTQGALVTLESTADRAALARCGKSTQKKAHKLVGFGDIEIVREVIRGGLSLNQAIAMKSPRPSKSTTDVPSKSKLESIELKARNQNLETENALLKLIVGFLSEERRQSPRDVVIDAGPLEMGS